jgi:seryl-tRNA(Sec) selenium transferase
MDRLKHLVSENNSLSAKLEECRQIIVSRDNEIEVLHNMVAEAGAMRSVTDNKIEELGLLQDYIAEIKEVVQKVPLTEAGSPELPVQITISEEELEEMKALNTYQQIQLRDLQAKLNGLKDCKVMMEKQSIRIAELESRLANANEERDQWKNFVMNKG